MNNILLSPPIAFLIMLVTVIVLVSGISAISFKAKSRAEGTGKSYACGEDMPPNLMQPDYSQFFPFAFFFTILHVVALMLATVPTETMGSFSIAVIYLLGAIVAMFILFRR